MAFDCKHVAALILANNAAILRERGGVGDLGGGGLKERSGLESGPSGAKPPGANPLGADPLGTDWPDSDLTDAARPGTQALVADPGWKSAITALAGSSTPGRTTSGRTATGDTRTARLGLLFELRELIPRSRNRWNGPVARTATGAEGGAIPGPFRLAVRPVIRSATGNWVRAGVTWSTLAYQVNRLQLDATVLRWFAQFAALHRSVRDAYGIQEPDWLYLDDFQSPLLWRLLGDATALEIPLLTGKKDTAVSLGAEVSLGMDARTDVDGDLRLAPVVMIDGREHPVSMVGAIGDHGVYSWQHEPRMAFTLAPTAEPLTERQRGLLERVDDLVVPAADVPEFVRDYYPALTRSIAVSSSDGSVSLPDVPPPSLVLTVTFGTGTVSTGTVGTGTDGTEKKAKTKAGSKAGAKGATTTADHEPQQVLSIDWSWRYGEVELPFASTDSARDLDLRDAAEEAAILDRAQRLFPVRPATLAGLDAAEFADRLLPQLEALDGLIVETVGERPDYRELTETPKLVVKTVETEHRDWFDLGVYVTVQGRDVPFTPLFTALVAGKKKLLLVDNSYLSLDQPVFAELRRLIEEAGELDEWETAPRISRYHASLWADFEDLADETEQAVDWRDSARGLLDVQSVPSTALPAGVDATLRPYQQEGFDWLAFLWRQRLGGILADDMGLGKTLQTLSLLAYARADAAAPFLVVAPTSVVSTWLAEAARFTPQLVVRAVTETQAKSHTMVADLARGADILITSYALFRLDFPAYSGQEWAGLILDEAQFVKNHASKAHQCAVDLATPFKLAITGTPMENSLLDLWSLLQIVAPGLFASSRRFSEEYVRPIAAGAPPELLAKLRRRIRPLMMRRTKELVAPELPPKQEQVLQVELAPRHRALYDTFLQKERQKLLGLIDDLDRNRFIVFRSLTLLRMLSLDASLVDEKYSSIPSSKLDVLFDQLEDVIAEGHRALVFSQFTSFLGKAADRMTAAGIEYQYLDGSTRKRSDVIQAFRDGDAPVFLISLKAGGFGLTLTEADYVFLLDPWWNPATESQAIDRTHRIGQSRSVNVYRLVASDTIEEKVMALKAKKAKLFDAVLDDEALFGSALTADDIRGLLD
ncbi:DEAD/DEAH box helicase [Lacisediminihabitans sp. G11-30]|uniref:DEAD/DEAH box helicase n=2 Tax=Lacisediminihabitans changchengi TaxID=2787634 RepID=A0A934SM93_9MICO|nr:DEAD/DEAH box helicase [Lacisediminihabitans changchengi]MBK4347965.1 DEAD/DEAH box helicase [Lacisediminihabitans changchengi]